jgi:hypothetical protein
MVQRNVKLIVYTTVRGNVLENGYFLGTKPEAVACCQPLNVTGIASDQLPADKTSDRYPQASNAYIRCSSFTLITSFTFESMLLNLHL